MKRILVFLLLGPALVVTAWLIYVPAGKGPGDGFVALAAMALFTFALFVASFAVLVDGYLADTLPIYLRAPLIAIVGAAIAGGLFLGTVGWMFPGWITLLSAGLIPGTVGWTLPFRLSAPFAISGALCMGACSLLSHDYCFRHRRAALKGGPPSNAG